jgi:2-keto-4-pentenoate hydratase
MTWVAVGAQLQGDWRSTTGEARGQIMGEHLPFYGNLLGGYQAAEGA